MTDKVIIIDSIKRELREMEWDIKGKGLRPLVGDWIETGWHWRATGDVLFVDERGLLKPSQHFFVLAVRLDNWPLAGIGVVVGRELIDKKGNWLGNADPVITIDQLKPLITFLSREEVDQWALDHSAGTAGFVGSIDKSFTKVTVHSKTTIGETFGAMPKPKK
jgi:hypothetical protein